MNELITISKLVKSILEENPQARNSDNILYLKLLEHQAYKKGIDITTLTVPQFLMKMGQYGFPSFETVRRSRQKIQATCPELAAFGDVGKNRAKYEKIYRDFAASDV